MGGCWWCWSSPTTRCRTASSRRRGSSAAHELEQAANYLNAHFAGRSLAEIRTHLLDELARTRRDVDSLMAVAVELAGRALSGTDDQDMVVAGQSNLLDLGEFADLQRLRELFEAFQRKHELLALARALQPGRGRAGLHRRGGRACIPLDHCTVVTAPYHAGGRRLGVLGVIGPTRMAYERIIPLVESTASVVSLRLERSV
ncbi:MAG: HrcA family transcriptional regulator [Xanthomonadales bacterium]|nr:HrcA family transcriptional regulator [Xanthomonadales bacterium]